MDRPPLEIGYIARPHGIRGEVVIRLHNTGSSVLCADRVVLLDDAETPRPCRVMRAKRTERGWIVVLDGVSDRDAAEALRGTVVRVAWEDLPALGPDEFYYEELRGFLVADRDGNALGEVVGLFETHVDNLVVRQGAHERYIPVVDEFVKSIDRESRRIEVELPEGFLDL